VPTAPHESGRAAIGLTRVVVAKSGVLAETAPTGDERPVLAHAYIGAACILVETDGAAPGEA
jgi:hypothetical protein